MRAANVPGADPKDIPYIEKCLAACPNPFGGQPIQNYKTIVDATYDTTTTAQPKLIDVDVLATQNATTSAIGVNVLSGVQVQTERPQGETCTR